MKKFQKRLLAGVLVLTTAIPSHSFIVKAESNSVSYYGMTEEQLKEKDEYDKSIAAMHVNNYQDIDEEPPMSVSEYKDYISLNYSSTARASYDPRTEAGFAIPDVRNQGQLGTCWAHSAMCMVEMNLAKQGYNLNDDMSEFQTVYFMNHDWTDPLGLCTNDNFHNITGSSSTTLSPGWYDEGGNTAYTKFLLMDWVGSVSEKEYPETAYNILETGQAQASLDDSYAINKDAAHVQDVTVINTGDRDVLKDMVLKYGSVGISYYHEDGEFYQNSCYYNNRDTTTNHAVAVVGWDDNYSKNAFKITPPGDGAWLVRNSWGSRWGDGGYFWLSYYDTSINNRGYVIQAYSSEDTDNYYSHNYQYDGGIATTSISYSSNISEVAEANIFEAQGKETLKAVSFYTRADYDYTIDIYKELENVNKPDSGTRITSASVSGTQYYEGYHTVPLGSNVSLEDGEKFSVVITLSANSSNRAYIALDGMYNSGSKYSYAEALEGQSFFRPASSSTWTDAAKGESANVRIKAYTVDAAEKPVTDINFASSSIELNAGDTYDLNSIITVNPSDTDDTIIFSSDNEKAVTVDKSGIITAKRPGSAVITAAARAGSATAEITVNVLMAVPAESIQLTAETLRLAVGSSKKIEAVLSPADTDDYATWSSSDVSVAKVDDEGNVTGISEGMAVIKAETLSGEYAVCQVTVEGRSSGEEINCTFDKLPKKIYKYNTYIVSLSNAMEKLSPVSITWESSSSNIDVEPAGENGTGGCKLYVRNVTSNKNKGEKVTIKATASYLKVTKKNTLTKTKVFKKITTGINLSYDVSLDKSVLYITDKGATQTLVPVLNEGRDDDQPTNTKLKWMITDLNGNKDKKGSRVASVNGKGVVKAKGPGTTYVTVCAADSYIKESKEYTVTATIQVTCRPVSSISFSEPSVIIGRGSTTDLKQKLVFNNGDTVPYNKDGMKLSWSSSDKKCVSVNGKGIIKAGKKAQAGTYTITVKATGGVPKGETVPEGTIQVIVP